MSCEGSSGKTANGCWLRTTSASSVCVAVMRYDTVDTDMDYTIIKRNLVPGRYRYGTSNKVRKKTKIFFSGLDMIRLVFLCEDNFLTY